MTTAILIGVVVAVIVGMLIGPNDAVIIQVVPLAEDDLIQVQVAGAVASPGVYSLPKGATVSDALQLAGGSTSDNVPEMLDLRSELKDGQFIHVPAPDSASDSTVTIIDINTATAEELETLPGIGPVIAERVVQHRAAIGAFSDVAQLADVNGISARMVEEIRSLVVVEAP